MKAIVLIPAGLILLAGSLAIASVAEPAAASLAFTSRDSVVLDALALVKTGKSKEAEELLASSTNGAGPEALRARAETSEIIRRTRLEYSLDAPALLARVQKEIPDATEAEAERWAAKSLARYRIIDGKKFFTGREPSNIFLFCDEARKRRAKAGHAPPAPKWKLTDHLKDIVTVAEKTGETEVQPIHHHVNYRLTIRGGNPRIHAGSLVWVWLPYPQEYRQQRDVKLLSASPKPTLIAPNAVEGAPVSGGAQRTVYFEQRVADPAQPMEFKEEFEYTSFAYYPKLDEAAAQPLPADWPGADYLEERPPHIVFTPEIREQVSRIIGHEKNPLTKARKLFRWVSAHVKWNAEDEYCIIPSFAIKGFTAGRGDCGVQNTVLITMCRIAGIPARWQSGWETKPSNWGMHDWAEIYLAPWGWLPADAAYGVQKSRDPRIRDFYCGHQDSYRMIVNRDWGRDLFPPKTSMRSELADFQRGEVEVDGENLYFDQWDYAVTIERDPGPNPEPHAQ
jgi:transglutaminase-like putative cysteine protease